MDFERGRTALKWRPRRLGVGHYCYVSIREVSEKHEDVNPLKSRRMLSKMVMIRREPGLTVVVGVTRKEETEEEVITI